MKKTVSAVLLLLMVLMLMLPASAATEPKITLQPQNYQYPEYGTAIYTVKATGTNLSATWYLQYEGKTYNISDMSNSTEPWEAYAGETYGPVQLDQNTFSCHFGGIEEGLDGAEIWCVIEDGHYDVASARAIITVQGSVSPPEILDIPASVTAYRGDSIEIRCTARSNSNAQLEFQWYETATGKLPNIQALVEEDTDYMFCSSEMIGTRYYVCCVTASDGGRAYSSVVPVTVLDADPEYGPQMEILTKKLPDATAGQPYQYKLECNDPTGGFHEYYNPGKANDFSKTGLTLSNNILSGTPQKAGSFTFTVCAEGDYGSDYATYTLTVLEAAQAPEQTEPEPTQVTEATEPAAAEPTQATEPEQTEPQDSGRFYIPWWGYLMAALAVIGLAITIGCCIFIIILVKKKS